MQNTDEKHSLKTRNVKIRYEFPYFWKIECLFFVVISMELLKNHVDFHQTWISGMCEIGSFFLDARILETEARKNAYKTYVFLMILILDANLI